MEFSRESDGNDYKNGKTKKKKKTSQRREGSDGTKSELQNREPNACSVSIVLQHVSSAHDYCSGNPSTVYIIVFCFRKILSH